MVYVLLGEGFEESEAIVPVDLLRRAGAEVRLVGLKGDTVTSSHGVAVKCDCGLKEVDEHKTQMLFLPGGLGGVEAISGDEAALGLIQRCADRGAYIAAICAAPTILMLSAVVQPDKAVVVDGHLITGRAAGSAFDFGLKLVEVLKGKDAADGVCAAVHYQRRK